MMKLMQLFWASVMTVLFAGVAHAGDISFNGGSVGNYNGPAGWTFSDGAGINVTATTTTSGKEVSWMTTGLGVGTNCCNQDFNGGESLTFTFNQSVTLAGIEFANWEGCCDDVAVVSIDGALVSLTYSGSDDTWMFDGGPISVANNFKLDNTGNKFLSIYRVQGLIDVTQVPIPAAAWLFGSGLIGLAGISRKRK